MGGRNCLQVVGLLMFIVGFPKNIIDMFAATLMLLHIWLSNVSLDTKARSMLHGTVASSRCPGHFWRIWMSSRSVSSDPMMFLVRIWYASLFHGRFYPLYIPYLPYLTPKKWSNLTFMYTPMAVPCSHNHPPTRDTRTPAASRHVEQGCLRWKCAWETLFLAPWFCIFCWEWLGNMNEYDSGVPPAFFFVLYGIRWKPPWLQMS